MLRPSPSPVSRDFRRFAHHKRPKVTSFRAIEPGRSRPLWLGWLCQRVRCAEDGFSPKIMSSLARSSDRETDELDAIRFHLSTEVNALQFHRKAETEDCAFKNTPILLQRLIQDVDHWLSNPRRPWRAHPGCMLYWPFKHFHLSRIYGERFECKRDAAALAQTNGRS